LVSQGDTPPDTTNANSVQSFAIGQAVEAANTSKSVALKDIAATVKQGDPANLAEANSAIMKGVSPEEAIL